MVCCRDCKYFDDKTEHFENGIWKRVEWCTFDGWLLTEDMIENGGCEAFDSLDDDNSA